MNNSKSSSSTGSSFPLELFILLLQNYLNFVRLCYYHWQCSLKSLNHILCLSNALLIYFIRIIQKNLKSYIQINRYSNNSY